PIRKSERSSVGSVEEVDLGDVMDSDELDAFLGPEVSAKNQPRSDDKKTKDEDDITGAIVVQEDNTELDDDSFKESPPPSVNECDDTVDDQKDCPAKETPTS
ncbi:uncharacterized protein LOC102803528, partial [Saccoglossus kowalevskii]|uniref:Uncharacterized protein LOC102803528 n=1 Tax=Saccoglossus kowalevskii TaxID=10224 RepID=A0ABM0M2K0_SACKO